MINKKNCVVLWSPTQKTFHIDTIEDMLKENMRIYSGLYGKTNKKDYKTDYIVLAFADSFEEAIKIMKKLQELKGNQDKNKT